MADSLQDLLSEDNSEDTSLSRPITNVDDTSEVEDDSDEIELELDFKSEGFLDVPESVEPPLNDPESIIDITPENEMDESTQFSRGIGNLMSAGRDIGEFITSGEIITAPAQGIVRGLEEVTEFGKSVVTGGTKGVAKGIDWVFDRLILMIKLCQVF